MKKIFILSSLIAVTLATPSFAEPTELDKKTVASKAYVDTKQDKITTDLVEFNDNPEFMLPAITTYDSTSGLVANKIGILDQETVASDEGTLRIYSYAYDYGSEMDNFVPTVRAVADALQEVQWFPFSWNNNVFPAAIDAYSVTFDPTSTHVNGNWPYNQQNYLVRADTFANSLALKQNKIETGLVEFFDELSNENKYFPTLVSYGTGTNNVDGLLANKIGILDQASIENTFGLSTLVELFEGNPPEAYDKLVPTVTAVMGIKEELEYKINRKQDKLPAAWTSTTSSAGMASTGGQTIDLGVPDGRVGRRYIAAGGSQPLTQKTGADNVILYINGTKTLAQYQTSNFGATNSAGITTNQNYIKGALVSLELLKDVYSALHTEIQNATPTGTPGNVAMYDPTTGELGDGVATYDGSTTYNASTDADKIAVMSGVQRKKECGGYEPGHENDPDYCWLWIFPD